jgi:methylphosphotriester-DNA--protein-cysteine methyltransferase
MTVYCNRKTNIAHRRGARHDPCYQRSLKKGNVEIYSDFIDAKRNGYRACKRCRPDQSK